MNGSFQNTTDTSNASYDHRCQLCGMEPLCGGLGMVRYDVPVGHELFGKMTRCPNNPQEQDNVWQQRLREMGNLESYNTKTFESFQTKISHYLPHEQETLQAALQLAEHYAQEPDGWLVLQGAYGTGKTHLAAAVGNALLARSEVVLFITVPDLLDHLRAAYGPSSEISYDETFERVRTAPVLILDDLGVENPSQWAQEKLFQLLNHRYVNQMTTIITTNAAIDRLDPRVHSRIQDLQVVRHIIIDAPDYRSRRRSNEIQLISDLNAYAHLTFDAFETEENVTNEERENLRSALFYAQRYAEQPSGWYVLIGRHGSGKTHLAAAIAMQQEASGATVMIVSVPDLLDYLRTAYSPDAKTSFDQRFQEVRRVPFLVLDDMGTENATSWAKEKLFQIVDYRYLRKLPTVITTSGSVEDMDDRLRSRLLDTRLCFSFVLTAKPYTYRRRPFRR